MKLSDVRLLMVNVVVVFESINLLRISRDRLREIGQGLPQPILTDIPDEVLLLTYPDRRLHCQFDRRRLTVSARAPEEWLVQTDLVPSMLHGAMAAMGSPGVIQAFGLNHAIAGKLGEKDPVGAHLRDRFLVDPGGAASALGGDVIGAGVRLQYSYPAFGSANTLSLEQGVDQHTLACALNCHFEPSNVPEASRLQELLVDGYRHLIDGLSRL